MSKIIKIKDKFIFFNDNNISTGTINIHTEKFIGATSCHIDLYNHLQQFKQTDIEYITEQIKKKELLLNNSSDIYFSNIVELEKLQTLKKELETNCNFVKNLTV